MQREQLDLTQEDGYRALKAHVASKASKARERYGPHIDLSALEQILGDRDYVRYPTRLVYDSKHLRAGEFAFAQMTRIADESSYVIWIHEHFLDRPEVVPALVAYHIPSVNYSDLVTPEEAELFGATLLGLGVEEYYEQLCALADELGPATGSTVSA